MPNNASSKKRVRQTSTRTLRNKVRRSSMRSSVRKVHEAIAAGDKSGAEALLPTACKHIDKAARHSVLHANTAANRKRKLTKQVNKLG